jgi:hypothetical protein
MPDSGKNAMHFKSKVINKVYYYNYSQKPFSLNRFSLYISLHPCGIKRDSHPVPPINLTIRIVAQDNSRSPTPA